VTYSIYFTDIAQGHESQWVMHPDTMATRPVVSATLTDAVNAASVLEFTIPRDHPALARMMESIADQANVKYYVHRDSAIIFEGRAYKYSRDDITGLVTFIIESEFARMNDVVVPPYHFTGTPREYLELLLDNAVVMNVGNVTVTDPNNYIVRSNEEPSILWDEIADKCIGSSLGGYIETDQSGTYVSWLATPSASGDQTIVKEINLLEMTDEADASSGFSGVYVYGAETGTENEYGQKQYVNLDGYNVQAELPSGYFYNFGVIFSPTLEDRYGDNKRILHCDNVTTPSVLIQRAIAYLESQEIAKTITVSALDMADLGDEVDNFDAGQTVTVTARDVTYNAMITRISRDLLDPSNTTFEFGATDNISGSGSASGGSGGGGTAISPYFWHTDVANNQWTPAVDEMFTGYSTQNLEDVLTPVVGGYSSIAGGAVWLRYTPPHNNVSYSTTNMHMRANGLTTRITSASMPLYENTLGMTGISATLSGKYSNTINAQVQVDGYNSNVDVTGSLRVFNQTANTVLAAPNGSNGTATFRQLLPTDTKAATSTDYFDNNVSSAVSVANVTATATTGGTAVTSFTLGKGIWLISAGVNFAANATGIRKAVGSTTSGALSTTNGAALAMQVSAASAGQTRVQICGIVLISSDNTTYYINAGQSSGSALGATCRARAIRLASN